MINTFHELEKGTFPKLTLFMKQNATNCEEVKIHILRDIIQTKVRIETKKTVTVHLIF